MINRIAFWWHFDLEQADRTCISIIAFMVCLGIGGVALSMLPQHWLMRVRVIMPVIGGISTIGMIWVAIGQRRKAKGR